MRMPALDCPSEQAIPHLPSAVNYVLSLCSLSFDSLFWSAFSHKSWSFLLPCSGVYLLLDNTLWCSAKNWWKYSSCNLTSVEQDGNTLDVSLLPAWWLLVLVPVLIHYRHHILWKTVAAPHPVFYNWLLEVQYLALVSTEFHPVFCRTFLQFITIECKLRHSQ